MHAYDAIIPSQVPIPSPIIVPPSPMLSPIFNPQEFFVPEELLPPKEQVTPAMTHAAIQQLVAESVVAALEACAWYFGVLALEHVLTYDHPTSWGPVHKQVTVGVPALVGQPPRTGPSPETHWCS
nr:hypothetical protein [Tanacetum cinerariifolium]